MRRPLERLTDGGFVIRITGGALRGRNLRVPAVGVRPTPSMVRQAVFSILGTLFPDGFRGRTMLDLFAGSGVMAVEAVSRGFATAVCVEKARSVYQNLAQGIRDVQLSMRIRAVNMDARRFLAHNREAFDFIYMDPPYAETELCKSVLESLLPEDRVQHSPLKPGGLVLLEQEARFISPEEAGLLKCFSIRRWGQTQVSFYHVPENRRISGLV